MARGRITTLIRHLIIQDFEVLRRKYYEADYKLRFVFNTLQ